MNVKYDNICGEACLLGYQDTTLAALLEAIDKAPNYSRWATTRQAILRAIDEGMPPSAPDTWPTECPHGGHRRSTYPEWDELRARLKEESASRKESKPPPGGGGGGSGGRGPMSHNILQDVTADQHHAQAHDLASHSTKAHAELSDAPADAHHPQLHEGEHRSGGGDELNHDNLAGFVVNEHKVLPNTIAEALSDHDKAAHDALNIDADQVDGEEAADIVTKVRVDAVGCDADTVDGEEAADIVTKARVDAIGGSHDSLVDVSVDDHHAQDHAARHQAGGADAIKLDDLAEPEANTDLNVDLVKHGLFPKLSGHEAECYAGDGAWLRLYDSTSIIIKILCGVSDNLRNSNDTERTTTVGSYTKVKETKMDEPTGVMRIAFTLESVGGETVYGRIYKNGVALGTARSTTTVGTWDEDLGGFVLDDLIQIYAYAELEDTAKVRNMRFDYDRAIAMLGKCTLATPIAITTQDPFLMTNQDP